LWWRIDGRKYVDVTDSDFEVISENQHHSIPEDNKNVFQGEKKGYRRKRIVEMQVYKTKDTKGM
jgi:hypothetical protein